MNSANSLIPEKSTRRELVEGALARIRDPRGEGAKTFTRVYADSARLAADTADNMARLGLELGPLAGVPVSLKDLFDVKGEITSAGSRVLAGANPATKDAEIVRRLRAAGAAIIGKTNMTEFAFSGLGLNPHNGTPLSPWDRANARIPGGSSSGAAISVTDGMAQLAIGTDTGGSCRIPAALNGLVGMKPSAQTIPMEGVLPLSSSYDSVGPIARRVDGCARVYSVLSASRDALRSRSAQGIRLGVLKNYVLEQMDETVGATYEMALKRLSKAGVTLQEISLPVLDELPSLFVNGGLVAAEAFAWHRHLLESRESEYDPRVAVRIRRGALISSADYISILERRRKLIAEWRAQIDIFDAVAMPTVPIVAPMLTDLEDDEAYGRFNLLMLRNPTVVNALDGCAISVPCQAGGEAPVGFSIACANGKDWDLLSVANALEPLL
jgi:aspartyl-tRNA(Asn)/glutamyl-tRNA(Gln) amidotransferase subunit A